MRKIPTIFVRDWDGTIGPQARYVLNEPHPDCDWVFAGEGAATRKLDGTSCLVLGGATPSLFKRFELRGDWPLDDAPTETVAAVYPSEPYGFIQVEEDLGGKRPKLIGWVPVGDGAEDKWHREGWEWLTGMHPQGPPKGTYELLGPKVQKNPEHEPDHILVWHADDGLIFEPDPPRDYDGLKAWLAEKDVEGIVWHHPDGRMAKIKGKDFGLSREFVHAN